MSEGLTDIRVLVTRPQQQAEQFSALIKEAGGIPISLPMLAIEESIDSESAQRCKFISGYDWVIFVSQNAVRYALSLLPETNWTDNTALAAVGQSTGNALHQAGFPVDLLPGEDMTSEGLLHALANKALEKKKVLIVRGVGGRETLAEGLRAKHALVDYAEVYRRQCPVIDSEYLSDLIEQGIDVVTIASGETLENVASIISNAALSDRQKQKLRACPLVVVSERIRVLAQQLGFTETVIVAKEPDNAGLLKAIQEWRSGENQ